MHHFESCITFGSCIYLHVYVFQGLSMSTASLVDKIVFRKVNEKMKKKGMNQRCKADRVVVEGNWEDYMWPHQVDKTSRMDPEVLSFLKKINLSKLTGIFQNEEVLTV